MPLLDQYGQPVRSIPARIPAAKWLSNQRLEVWHGITPDKMAALFRRADMGDLAAVEELWSAIQRMDGHVHCETGKRQRAVSKLDDQLVPASEGDVDNKICDFVRENVLEHPQFEQLKNALNAAPMTGIACAEPVWAEVGGKIIIKEFRRLPVSRLTYTGLDGLLLDWPMLLTDEQPSGVPLDPRNIILHCGNVLAEHPVRMGAFRPVAWMVMLKHYSIKDWWRFGESFGIPMRLGKYDQGASPEDRLNLFDAVRLLGSDGAAVVSKDTEIALLEAASSGNSAIFYEVQNAACNAEISKAIIGATLATEVGTKGGSRAAADTHLEVQKDLLIGDGKLLAATISQQLIKPLVQLNFGPSAPLPKYRLTLPEREDYEKKTKWLEAVANRVPLAVSDYYEQYGLRRPEIDEETVGGTAPPKKAPQMLSAKRSAPADPQRQQDERQAVIDRLAARAAEETAAEFARNQAEIVAAVRKAKDWNEALSAVAALFPQLETKQLNRLLAQSMTAAQVYGRKTGQDDAAGRQDS